MRKNKKFSLVFLFNKDLSKVLLVHKLRSIYSGKLNGVGGKKDFSDYSMLRCAVRETKEETGCNMSGRLDFLVRSQYPSGIDLYVYYGVVNESEVSQVEDEVLEWFDVSEVLRHKVTDYRYAGEGNVQHYVYSALRALQFVRY